MTKSNQNPIPCRRRREESLINEEIDQRLHASSFGLLSFPLCGIIWLSSFMVLSAVAAEPSSTVVLVIGAAGEAEYGSNFVHQAELWKKACSEANAKQIVIGLDKEGHTNDYEQFKQ